MNGDSERTEKLTSVHSSYGSTTGENFQGSSDQNCRMQSSMEANEMCDNTCMTGLVRKIYSVNEHAGYTKPMAIHQQALCRSLKLLCVTNPAVAKEKFTGLNVPNHCQFPTILTNIKFESRDLPYLTIFPWLSHGKVLRSP